MSKTIFSTGKNNGFPFLDILGYLKNAHKNPKFGRVRQVPIRELGWEFPGWDLSHFAKFGIFFNFNFGFKVLTDRNKRSEML